MTTTDRITPATAAQLTEALDATLKAPAGAPNTATTPATASGPDTSTTTTEPRPRLLLGDIAAVLPTPRAQTRPMPTPTQTRPAPTAGAVGAPAVVLTEAGASPLPVYPWDPMPTSGDPCGLRERMEYVEAAIAARAVSPPAAAPHTRPAGGPVSPLVEARFVEAHQRLDEMLG